MRPPFHASFRHPRPPFKLPRSIKFHDGQPVRIRRASPLLRRSLHPTSPPFRYASTVFIDIVNIVDTVDVVDADRGLCEQFRRLSRWIDGQLSLPILRNASRRVVSSSSTINTCPADARSPIFNFDPFPQDPSPGYILLAPRGPNVTRPGAVLLDWSGGLVWDGAEYGEAMDFSVQTYLGNQVIALWVGQFNTGGYGQGHVLLLDQTYTVVANM